MSRGPDLNDFQRGQIYSLRFHAHWNIQAIADVLFINKSTVKKYCQRVLEKEAAGTKLQTDRKGKCGRDECTTQRENRRLTNFIRNDRFATAVGIKKAIGDVITCSARTISRRLNSSGFKARSTAVKTLLDDDHKLRRLEWSVRHLDWTIQQWRRVLFCDESQFVLTANHARYVRRRINERYLDVCVAGRANRGVGGIMVWAVFGFSGYGNLVLIHGRLDAAGYVQLLEANLLPNLNRLLPEGGIFMQDNAPIHSARITTNWLHDNNINVLPWPAYSPDMNPIENAWAIMKHDLKSRVIHNRHELLTMVQQIWNNRMADEAFRVKLIDSMPSRVRSLHIARGSHTKY